MSFTLDYLVETVEAISSIDQYQVELLAGALGEVGDRGGRIFFLGVGGDAGHALHAASDFRKLAWIESYTPCDNVTELTALINDEGWESSYAEYLAASNLTSRDAVFVFSVGGGSRDHALSVNVVNAVAYALGCNSQVFGIVGPEGGYTAEVADVCVRLSAPVERVTAHVHGLQDVLLHLLLSHPAIAKAEPEWESRK